MPILDGDGAKRFWLATKEREIEAIRRMCAYYVVQRASRYGSGPRDEFYPDFKIAHSWYMKNRGVFKNVPANEPKG
jgi:hypothetical protein